MTGSHGASASGGDGEEDGIVVNITPTRDGTLGLSLSGGSDDPYQRPVIVKQIIPGSPSDLPALRLLDRVLEINGATIGPSTSHKDAINMVKEAVVAGNVRLVVVRSVVGELGLSPSPIYVRTACRFTHAHHSPGVAPGDAVPPVLSFEKREVLELISDGADQEWWTARRVNQPSQIWRVPSATALAKHAIVSGQHAAVVTAAQQLGLVDDVADHLDGGTAAAAAMQALAGQLPPVVYQSVSQVDARAYREVHGPRPLLLLGPPLLVSKLMGILEHDPPPAADGPDLRNQRVNHARQPRQPRFQQAVAATTRAPVPGEEDGDHFHFWSRDQLLRAVHEGTVIEGTEHGSNLYGMPVSSITEPAKQYGVTVLMQGVSVQSLVDAMLTSGIQPLIVHIKPDDNDATARRKLGRLLHESGTEPTISAQDLDTQLLIARQFDSAVGHVFSQVCPFRDSIADLVADIVSVTTRENATRFWGTRVLQLPTIPLQISLRKRDGKFGFTIRTIDAGNPRVAHLVPGSPAARSSLQVGQMIVKINGVAVAGLDHLACMTMLSSSSDDAMVTVVPDSVHGEYLRRSRKLDTLVMASDFNNSTDFVGARRTSIRGVAIPVIPEEVEAEQDIAVRAARVSSSVSTAGGYGSVINTTSTTRPHDPAVGVIRLRPVAVTPSSITVAWEPPPKAATSLGPAEMTSPEPSASTTPAKTSAGQPFSVELTRGPSGLDMTIYKAPGRKLHRITGVTPLGVADKAGLQQGDVILKANGIALGPKSHEEVVKIITAQRTVTLKISQPVSADESTPASVTSAAGQDQPLNMMSPSARSEFGVGALSESHQKRAMYRSHPGCRRRADGRLPFDWAVQGPDVVIAKVERNDPSRLKVGDVLKALDGALIEPNNAEAVLAMAGNEFEVEVIRYHVELLSSSPI